MASCCSHCVPYLFFFVSDILFHRMQLYCFDCSDGKVVGSGRAPIAQPISTVCLSFVTVVNF